MRAKTQDDAEPCDVQALADAFRPLVTVIVPIYGVEPYLRACIDSILVQTYPNLEIILVDDGSPDGCPAICDEYARRDGRIRVIHKPNGGLSDARNAALDVVTGAYIGFIDSDDIVEPTMYEAFVAEALATGADVVACGYLTGDLDDPSSDMKRGGVECRRELSAHDATLLLLKDDELQNYVWNKLFAARLWEGVRFPVGQKFEDVNTTYKLIEAASKVVLLPDLLYRYRVRGDGIVKSRKLAGEIDCVEANLQRYEALADRYPEARRLMVDGVLHAMVRVWPLVWQERAQLDGRMRDELDRFARFAREHAPESGLGDKLGPTGRLTLSLIRHAKPWSWFASWALYRLYLMRHGS